MADPDADSDEEFDDSPDYYSVLNVRKEASGDEIKAAYHRMCVMYHPDKHLDSKNKQAAETIFSKIHKAYEVLSSPEKRTIYDVYGQKGLDAGWEVIERKRSPQEIREEYERLQREAEQRRIEQKTNPQGSTTLRIDATDLFNKEDVDDPYYEDEKSFIPHLEIRGMSIKQSIEAPLTKDHTAILCGSIQHTNGNGGGSVDMTLRKIFSHQSWGEMEVGVGNGPQMRLKGFRNINKKTFGTISINSTLKQSVLTAGLQGMVARQLAKGTMGYLTWTGGSMSAMSSVIVRNTEKYHLMAQLQLGVPHSFAVASYTYKFNDDNQAKISVKYGILGFVFDYGCQTKITSLSRIGATVSIGQASGVTLKVKVHRHTQSFNFPILLCDVISPSAVFYGTMAPVVAYFTVKALFIVPLLRQQREKNLKETREKYAQHLIQKREEAEEAIEVMIPSYERSVETEQQRHGLVITEAWYGKSVSSNEGVTDVTLPHVINVTVPLQCLVKDSKLLLTDASKSQLNGFYDPCINEDKYLKIVYEFRDALHEAVFQDDEPVRIPKQCSFIIQLRSSSLEALNKILIREHLNHPRKVMEDEFV